ncbi:MAG: FG-GAP-like repeat-containing protein [Candidatus Kryptonium sp.]|nr:FG-GAP-like repeat-containing protein [Candidatus Kryptonium sp.]
MRKIYLFLTLMIVLYFVSFSQAQYPLFYLKDGFRVSYVANYSTIPKIDGCDDVIAGLDLNKNGKLEILAINDPTVSSPASGDTTKWVFLFENDGNDNYRLLWSTALPLTSNTTGYSFPGVNVTDVDGDGNFEITVVNPSNADVSAGILNPDKIFFYEYDPRTRTFPTEPTFAWNLDYPADGNAGFRLTYLFPGDFDRDGRQEIALIDRTSRIHMWIISLETPELDPFSTFKVEFRDSSLTATWAFDITTTDFDRDGKQEIWFGTWTNFTWVIVEAEGPDNYVIKKVISNSHIGSGTVVGTLRNLKFMDMDGDRYPEGFAFATNGQLVYIENKKPADVSEIDSTYFHKVGGWDYTRGADWGDLDGDGNLDVVVAGNYRNVYHVEYKGSGAFKDSTSWEWSELLRDTLGTPRYYYVSFPPRDMDGDGRREFVIGSLQRPDSTRAFFIVFERDVIVKAQSQDEILTGYYLAQNYPNPFNPVTWIEFALPKDEFVTLKIYTIDGRLVRTLVENKYYPAGKHLLSWDGRDDNNLEVASGVYIYKISAGKFETSRKMILLR